MKFRVRFADQIVGFFIIAALASLAFVIVMMGRSQRWFARDTPFYTEFASVKGLSKNMPVLYRGFTIGNVESFTLNTSDQVEVFFFIHEEYRDRVRLGSVVELLVSPVGLGNEFLFHPGKGEDLAPENGFIPAVGSVNAQAYIRQGLADAPRHDDSITVALNRASSTLDGTSRLMASLNEALTTGSDETVIGQMVGSLNRTIAGAETLPDTVNAATASLLAGVEDITTRLDETLESINPIIADMNALSSMIAAPDGTVAKALDSEGELYQSLTRSLESLSGIMDELDKTAAFVPRQLPQMAGLITDLRVTLKTAEDVLVALTNNPLLRKGIPDHVEVQSSGTSPRDISF